MIHEIEQLKDRIDESVNTNGQRAITGAILNNTLKDIVDTLGQGRTFAGIIHPESDEPEHDDTVFYIATEKGTYFPQALLPVIIENDGINIIYWNFYVGKWMKTNVIDSNVNVAFLTVEEIDTRVMYDASHDIISDGLKFRVIVGNAERVASRARILFLFCKHTFAVDYYITPPEYNDHDGELIYYMMGVSNTRDGNLGGYPYTMKQLTIGGVSETDI